VISIFKGEDGQKSFSASLMATRELLNCFSLEVTSTLIHKTMMVEQHSSRLVKGHEAVVKVLLSRNDVAINTTATDSDRFGTYPGRTALLAASVVVMMELSNCFSPGVISINFQEKMVKQRSFQLPVMATRESLNCFSLEVIVDINSQDNDGRTALFKACQRRP
jgi:hypothetical protein